MANLTDAKNSFLTFSDPSFLNDRFNPGHWLDRRQINTPSSIAITGNYERLESVWGGIHSKDVHFYDLCLAQRPSDAKGHLVDYFLEPQPLGEVIFVPAGSRYAGGGGPGKQRNLFLFLHAGILREEDPQLAEILSTKGKQDYMDLRCDRIRFLLAQICQELYEPGFASELMIEGLSTTLLAETARLMQQSQNASGSKGGLAPVNLRKIRERTMYGGHPPSLEELAKLCNLSQRHLMRSFQESTGQTVGQYIKNTILERAQSLLRITDMPISLIAEELGFISASSFSTAFRRLTGESPRAFRSRQAPYNCDADWTSGPSNSINSDEIPGR